MKTGVVCLLLLVAVTGSNAGWRDFIKTSKTSTSNKPVASGWASLTNKNTAATAAPAPKPVTYDGKYIVLAPSVIRGNMHFRIGVNILKTSVWCKVTATIKKGATVIVSGKGNFRKGQAGKISMKIPEDLEKANYKLTVKSTGGVTFTKHFGLTYAQKRMALFIETDRPIYKPGDTVRIRAFGLYPNLKAYAGAISLDVIDANKNVIKQWPEEKPGCVGVTVKEFVLSKKPVLGKWTVVMNTGKESTEKTFRVLEYIRPKFEVQIDMPSFAVSTDKEVPIQITAKSMSGAPIVGEANVDIRLPFVYTPTDGSNPAPKLQEVTVPINGKTIVTASMDKIKEVCNPIDLRKLQVQASVNDNFTETRQKSFAETQLYTKAVDITFLDTATKTFKPGFEYLAQVKLSQRDGTPIKLSNKKLHVSGKVKSVIKLANPTIWSSTRNDYDEIPAMTLAVPESGIVTFAVPTNKNSVQIEMKVKYDGEEVKMVLKKAESPSNSYLHLRMLTKLAIKAGDTFQVEVLSTTPMETINYQIMSSGEILYVHSGPGSRKTSVILDLKAITFMAPSAKLLVYVVNTDNEVVADSIGFDVSGAFRNKVTVSTEDDIISPNAETRMQVNSDPDSHIFFLAKDQRSLRLADDNLATQVHNELNSFGDATPEEVNGADNPLVAKVKTGTDANAIFEDAGLTTMSDALVFNAGEEAVPLPSSTAQSTSTSDVKTIAEYKLDTQKLETNFGETWLWNEVKTCANGQAQVITSAPEYTTSWVTSAFAINCATGFGLPEVPLDMKVFRRFRISVDVPSPVTIGEEVAVEVTIFNEMEKNMVVKVSLEKSPGFTNLYLDCNGVEYRIQKDQYMSVKVPAGHVKTVFFPIIPLTMGYVEIVAKAQSLLAGDKKSKQMRVVSPGVQINYNVPVLLDVINKHNHFSKKVKLSVPANTVPGSEKFQVSAVGDLIGPSISGLESLIEIPTGNGEHTMLGLAPDVAIAQYLKSVNKLTGELKDKTLKYMELGYQNQLQYRRDDGSFSAFADDDAGSVWLTAFAARVFNEASEFMFIDFQVKTKAVKWLIAQQKATGEFVENGEVINTNMKSQASSTQTLSAFVLISLLENKDLFTESTEWQKVKTATDKCLKYLEAEVAKSEDVYLLAMASYAFQLAESSQNEVLLNRLLTKANTTDGNIHWQHKEMANPVVGTWQKPNLASSATVEMTSYVLMTYSLKKDVNTGRKIMRWITQHRNSLGGFASTQDTVAALKALSLYSELVFMETIDLSAECVMDNEAVYKFRIDNTNAMVTQTKESKMIPAEVAVSATGRGLALIELGVSFNVEAPIQSQHYKLNIKLTNETSHAITLHSCASWLGEGDASGLAIQEVVLPSGFELDNDELLYGDELKSYNTEGNTLFFYFNKITKDTPVCIHLTLERTGLVANNKLSYIKVYESYDPTKQATAFYTSDMLKKSKICKLCPDCHNCSNKDEGPPEGYDASAKAVDDDVLIERELNSD